MFRGLCSSHSLDPRLGLASLSRATINADIEAMLCTRNDGNLSSPCFTDNNELIVRGQFAGLFSLSMQHHGFTPKLGSHRTLQAGRSGYTRIYNAYRI